ncbi:F0F1 ATP synthase subunit delta [Clostridium hydrogenum]|uniref:F0F1 ATP synthase subunit delta n=1 Tax=Clostridium hydrogenum TaxID=2855764 RepID=UPI001F34C1AD|nr:F0F1 ATP synthase subunit delta [Clostridium hydrogenum]
MYEYLDRRYALALYEVGAEKNKVDQYIKDFSEIVDLINANNDIQQIINHPKISTSGKKKMFMDIFQGKVDKEMLSFLLLLIEKKRIHEVSGILNQLNEIALEKANKVIAEIKTVIPLTDNEREQLKDKLEKKYNKTIILKEVIDKEIIGGVYVRVGDDVIDGTIKNKLESMKKVMLKRE